MRFEHPLVPGNFIKRYKRFLVDIQLKDGRCVTAHCANSGSMEGLLDPYAPVWLSEHFIPTRKLPYTWQIVDVDDTLVGVSTYWPNILAAEAIAQDFILPLSGYGCMEREVNYGKQSRVDLCLLDEKKPRCYVEVKNVHLKRGEQAQFPDAVTERGKKHLYELIEMVNQGNRGVMLYIVQRNDCKTFGFAADIDPAYTRAARLAQAAGVEFLAYACTIDLEEIKVSHALEVII